MARMLGLSRASFYEHVRRGNFLACSGYPECRTTKEVVKNLDGTWEIVPEPTTD